MITKPKSDSVLPKYVYTGYSDKHDGILIVCSEDWDDFCAACDGTHHFVGGEHLCVNRHYSDDDLAKMVERCETYSGVMKLYRAELVVGANLTDAICW